MRLVAEDINFGALAFALMFLALILFVSFLSSRKQSIAQGTWLGTAGMKAKHIWNHASREQRSLMLAAIDLPAGTTADLFLSVQWSDLPASVQISLARTLEEIRNEDQQVPPAKHHTTTATTGNVQSRQTTNPKGYGDYGTLLKPPSNEANNLLSPMTETEKSWFTGLLEHAQKWHESEVGQAGLIFHPEARTAMWALALSKIADRYHESSDCQRALFFADAAWKLSRYPVFAFNTAVLHMALEQEEAAKPLLYSYLAEYKNIHSNSVWQFINPAITSEQLEKLADSARVRLTAIGV